MDGEGVGMCLDMVVLKMGFYITANLRYRRSTDVLACFINYKLGVKGSLISDQGLGC